MEKKSLRRPKHSIIKVVEPEEEDIIICESVWNLIMVNIIQTIRHFKFPMYE
jgi:hypothetical protein